MNQTLCKRLLLTDFVTELRAALNGRTGKIARVLIDSVNALS